MNKGNSPENYIFVPGTKAYSIFLGKRDEKSKCKACNGKGKIVLRDGEKYECPSCYGKGFHWVKTPDEWLLEDQRTITQIDVREKEIVYFFNCNGAKSENVFLTIAEAQKEIAKRNKVLKDLQKIERELNENN